MRTAEDINQSIKSDFANMTGHEYRAGSALGFFTDAVSRSMENAYQEIENSKNPHIYTNLSGADLDKFGAMVNVPRQVNESDTTYLYRLMNWTYLKSGANLTAINDSILNLTYASDAQYYPGIYGAGTGVVYIIPKEYTNDTITKALSEVKDRLHSVLDPESYTEYVVPTALPVTFVCHLETSTGDKQYLQNTIENKIKEYVNAIAPNDYLSVGAINKIGLTIETVDFFSVDGIYINDVYHPELKILQNLETKMLFQEVTWED